MLIMRLEEPEELVMMKVCAAEGPAVGAGLVTVALTGPASLSSEPGMVMVRLFPSTAPPVLAMPPKLTTAPWMRLLPVRVRVTGWPNGPVFGEIPVSVGTGLLLVSAKLAVAPRLATPAATVKLPAKLLAVNTGEEATPLALVVALALRAPPGNVASAPLVSGVTNSTVAPPTGPPEAFLTVTTKGAAKAVLM